jgi:arylsulfatase A-like enzyme
MEAHAPLQPSRSLAGTFVESDYRVDRGPPKLNRDDADLIEYKMARYDEEILELDAALGDLLVELEQRGVLDRSWLVITADHGESFGEHGATEHGTNVYGNVTWIPLLIQPPRGVDLIVRDDAVSLLDVTATLSAIGGREIVGDGRDLRWPWPDKGVVKIEFFGDPRKVEARGAIAGQPQRAVIRGDAKLIERAGQRELYRLRDDPGERRDLLVEKPALVAELEHELPPLREGVVERERIDLSSEDEAELRALGYIY